VSIVRASEDWLVVSKIVDVKFTYSLISELYMLYTAELTSQLRNFTEPYGY
jgi:hypothetical protein